MELIDYLGQHVIATPAGLVSISVARHEDGVITAVAWRRADGRRVGYLRQLPGQPQPLTLSIAPELSESPLAALLQRLGGLAQQPTGALPTGGGDLRQLGVLAEPEVRDLLGLEWLLSELGEPQRFGELATSATLDDVSLPR